MQYLGYIKKLDLRQIIFKDVSRLWKGGVFHLTFANWGQRVSAFGARVVLARLLGAANIGHIAVVQSVLQLIRLPASAGTFTVVTKLMAENIGNIKNQKEVIGTTIWINIGTSLIIGLIGWLILNQTNLLGDDIAKELLKVLLILLPIMIFNQVFESALMGQRRIKTAANLRILRSFLTVGTVAPLAVIWSLNGWLINQFILIIIIFLTLLFLLRMVLSLKWNSTIAKRTASIGSFAFASQLTGIFIFQIDTLAISGILNDPVQTGIYNTGALIASQIMVFPGTIMQTIFPVVSQNKDNLNKLKARYKELTIKIGLIAFLTALLASVLSPWILAIFGKKFVAAVPAFCILASGRIIRCFCMINNTYLDALGRTDINFYGRFISCCTALGLNLILIPRYNILGAAWATTLSFIMNLIISYFAVQYFIFYKKAIR